jgi:hypothetical protein
VSVVDRRNNVSVVDSREVLVRMLVDEGLDLLDGPLELENVVVDGACSALDGGVSAKVEVVLVRLGDSRLDQGIQQSNGVLVTAVLLREGMYWAWAYRTWAYWTY